GASYGGRRVACDSFNASRHGCLYNRSGTPRTQEEILNHKSREWDERDARQGRSGSGGEAGMPNHESRNSGSLSCISSFAAFLIKPRSIPGFLIKFIRLLS